MAPPLLASGALGGYLISRMSPGSYDTSEMNTNIVQRKKKSPPSSLIFSRSGTRDASASEVFFATLASPAEPEVQQPRHPRRGAVQGEPREAPAARQPFDDLDRGQTHEERHRDPNPYRLEVRPDLSLSEI